MDATSQAARTRRGRSLRSSHSPGRTDPSISLHHTSCTRRSAPRKPYLLFATPAGELDDSPVLNASSVESASLAAFCACRILSASSASVHSGLVMFTHTCGCCISAARSRASPLACRAAPYLA
eukprot:3933075-Rhodomonas_salina.4